MRLLDSPSAARYVSAIVGFLVCALLAGALIWARPDRAVAAIAIGFSVFSLHLFTLAYKGGSRAHR
jgi:glycerol uptake facilitator-like aquaporin